MASYMYYNQPYHGHTQSMGNFAPFSVGYGYYGVPQQVAAPAAAAVGPTGQQPYLGHHRSASYNVVLPPPGMSYMNAGGYAQPAHMAPPVLMPSQAPPAEAKVNGGVREVLDYDLALMSEYVVKNAFLIFDSDEAFNQESGSVSDVFTKGVNSVLNATRLPSVTVFLALDLLRKYLVKLPNGTESAGGDAVNVIYQTLMIAFVLANKFNDDKTFTNKSWSQATGMEIATINEFEREWLAVFEWRLFDDKFVLYSEYSQSFEHFCRGRMSPLQAYTLPSPTRGQGFSATPSSHSQSFYGFQTPLQSSSMVYSSPCYTDERSNTSNFFPPASFASPLSNGSPMTKHGINGYGYNYYSNAFPGMAPAPAPIASGTFWNTPADDFKRNVVSSNVHCCLSN
ncbi:LAMI_0D02674g1_1 [Lachancea mirantina]|uniref:LAMI_0D02674g1_1 n=1 Tax=Lachancea mirantina TaxID=1230905 RepID=A0A1G4J9A5_9SACH|nr:LAMI_0D02674g1_1 [Lachancea mirantina]